MPDQHLRIYRVTTAESEEALRFYTSGGTDTVHSVAAVQELRHAIRKGTWRIEDQIVARRGNVLVGSIPFFISPSRTAVIAFPSTAPSENPDTLTTLVKAAVDAAARQGASLSVALIPLRFPHGGIPFLSAGFHRVAVLTNMESASLAYPSDASSLNWITYDNTTHHQFEHTFSATLEGTLDCPSLPRVQTAAEVLEGHKLAGEFRPDLWLLALMQDRAIGCVLINQLRKPGHFCLVYLGVVPHCRGQRYGETLMRFAISRARRAGATKISLSVDEQNRPAVNIYQRLGFRPTDKTLLYALSIPRSP